VPGLQAKHKWHNYCIILSIRPGQTLEIIVETTLLWNWRMCMKASMKLGEFVKIPDGRIGFLIERNADKYTVRVRQQTGTYHQFLYFTVSELKAVTQSKKNH
jgi:hypothetical protein